jgi:hypothetical protein
MSERISRSIRLVTMTAILAVCAVAMSAGSAMASSAVVYNNIPGTLPGNFASVGAEAYSYGEFGGEVELAGAARNKPIVEVVMSSWGCQFGAWFNSTCETPKPTKKTKIPMTLKIYEVGEKNALGEEIGKTTHTFAMPYRPSDDHVNCPAGGRWFQASSGKCFHGLAFKVKFPPLKTLRLPKRVILGVSYNTSHYGPAPLGDKNACNTTSAGCYYDSLNVGLAEPAENLLETGADVTEPFIHILNGGAASEACGNEAAALAGFAASECNAFWEGDQPLFKITAK